MQTVLEKSLITLDGLPEAYIRIDGTFRCTFANQAAQQLLDQPAVELLGKKLWDLYPENLAKPIEERIRRAMAEHTVARFELYDRSRRRRFSITAMPETRDGILVRLSHITDGEGIGPWEQQTPPESQLHGIARNLPGFIYQTYVRANGEWGVSFADKRALDIFGIDPEPLETVFKRFAACIALEDQERFINSIRESTRSQKDWEFEGRFITPTGETKYIQGVSRARQLSEETVHDGIILDVTHHKHAEQALRESEELYRQLFEVESDALLLVDRESSQILAANAAAVDLYGYSRDELLTMSHLNLSAQPDESMREMQGFNSLLWHTKRDRTVFPVEVSARCFNLKGRPLCVYAVRNISDRRLIEESLRKSEEKFSKSFHSNPAAIVIADLTNELYLEVNETFEKITGYRRDEIVGRSWSQVRLWADPHERDRALQQILKDGHTRNFEFGFRKKSGELGTGLLSAELIEIGGHQCTIAATIDITERCRLDLQLRQAQKLEGLGRLAGGVAHDFNNLLIVINGYSDFVLKRLATDDPLYLPAQEINKAGERAASLTKQLLAFSRKQLIEPRPLDLNMIVNDAERMFQRLIGEDIELATSLDPLLGQIMADPAQIQQVIMNLVINARDAMNDGGKLEISTRNVDIDESAARAHPDVAPGRCVLMTVTDTGIGMSEETMQRIFDPFFTTKRQDIGTGLGLAMVYGAVRQSGGWIEVSSQLGQGASFRIYLPRIDSMPRRDGVEPPIPVTLCGSETVLVVEDQEEVRRLIRTILESYGYHVLEAENGTEALRLAEERQGDIHLLLTDIILPGMNGKTLSEQVKVLLPKLKIVFMSGYPEDLITRRGVLEQDIEYLPKPFSPQSLALKVREVLTGHSTSR
jgi:PAS domain S-box-containing protein